MQRRAGGGWSHRTRSANQKHKTVTSTHVGRKFALPLLGPGDGMVQVMVVKGGLDGRLAQLHDPPATHHLYHRDHTGPHLE